MINKIFSLVGITGVIGGLSLLAAIMPSWYLNGDDFGYYSQFYVSISLGILILGFGLNTSLTYHVGQGGIDQDYVMTLLNRQDFYCIITFVILLIFSGLCWEKIMFSSILLGLGVSCLQVRNVNLPAIALGKRNIRQHNLLSLVRPITLVLPIVIWSFFANDRNLLMILIVLFSVAGYLLSLKITRMVASHRDWPQFIKASNIRQVLKYGFISQISNISYTLGQRAFVYILSIKSSPYDSGLFFIVLSLIEVVLIIPTSTGKYFFSYASGGGLKKKEIIIAIIFALSLAISSNLVLFFSFNFLKNLNMIEASSVYYNINFYILLTVPLQFIMFFLRIFSSLACGYGLVRLTMYGSIAGGVLSVGSGILLIPNNGISGALHALFLGNGVNLIIVILGVLILTTSNNKLCND